MGSYFSLHPVPFPLWGLDKRVKQRAAQMMNVVGCLIITHPSSPSFSLHPQGSHLLLTPHLPHISLSKHMLTFYSQRRASAALKPHTHTLHLSSSQFTHTHTPAVTAGVQAALFVLWSSQHHGGSGRRGGSGSGAW